MKVLNDMSDQLTVTAIGKPVTQGTYILRIAVAADLTVVFGRFKGGKSIHVPSGEYLYVGSALSIQGSTSLPRRLIRHVTRSSSKGPHPIRDSLMEHLQARQILPQNPLPKHGKKLHWNVDYLLEPLVVSVTGIILIYSPERLEGQLARWLSDCPVTSVLEKGLGANDDPGATHLLRLDARPQWWHELAGELSALTGLCSETVSPNDAARGASERK